MLDDLPTQLQAVSRRFFDAMGDVETQRLRREQERDRVELSHRTSHRVSAAEEESYESTKYGEEAW